MEDDNNISSNSIELLEMEAIKMFEHMIDWIRVRGYNMRITPKGIESVYGYIGVPNETFVVITGNRENFTMPIILYPKKLIPVYGF